MRWNDYLVRMLTPLVAQPSVSQILEMHQTLTSTTITQHEVRERFPGDCIQVTKLQVAKGSLQVTKLSKMCKVPRRRRGELLMSVLLSRVYIIEHPN